MKRIYERILFMGIGAFIAFLAYSVGTIENGVNAQHPNLGEIIECDTLHVSKNILVGNLETGSTIKISPSNILLLGDNLVLPKVSGAVSISTNDDMASISLVNGDIRDLENPDSYMLLVSGDGTTKIIKVDKSGRKEY